MSSQIRAPGLAPVLGRLAELARRAWAGPDRISHIISSLRVCGYGALLLALLGLIAGEFRSNQAEDRVAHAIEVRRVIGDLWGALQEAESSARVYQLLQAPDLSVAFNSRREGIPKSLARLRALTKESADQQARLDVLEPLVMARLTALATALETTRASPDQGKAGDTDGAVPGAASMTQIREQIRSLDQAQNAMLGKREAAATGARRLLLGGMGCTFLLVLLLSGADAWLTRRRASALIAANRRLDQMVQERTLSLRDSEARFHQVFRDSPIGMAVVAAENNRFVAANPSLCRMLGYDETMLVGRPEAQFTHRDHRSMLVPIGSATNGPTQPVDRHYLTRGGILATARVRIASLNLPRSGEELFLLLAEDVTRERATERALRESEVSLRRSETQLRMLITSAPAAIAMFDREMRYLASSRRYSEDLRLGDGDLVGRSHYEVFPEIPDHWREIHKRCQAGATESCEEERFTRADGSVDWVRWQVQPWRDQNDEIGGVILLSEIITARKEAELALRESEALARQQAARFAAVYASAPIGLAVLDRELRWVAINDRLAAINGYPVEAHIGRTRRELIPSVAEQTDDLLRDVIATGEPADRLEINAGIPGVPGMRDWLVSYYPVRDADGTVTGVSSAVVDITDLKQMEARLRAEIAAREAVQAQLIRSQRLEAVGQLTGGLAHNFNNLLGVIIGNAEFVMDEIGDRASARELLNEILTTAEQGAELTRRMLAFGRRQPLQPAVIDLNAELPAHVTLLRRLLGETIDVTARLAPDLWLTRIDPSQAADVLLNLAINARDAMPRGGRLAIETANVILDAEYCAQHGDVSPGEYVALTVTDNGTGMAPEVLAQATEPFFTTKGPDRGTGLGLSMCFGFAKQSGGHLSLHSEVGVGTTVRLYLPRTEETAGTDPAASGVGSLPNGHETILLVEDNEAVRKMAVRSLTVLGYRLYVAENGPAALAILDTGVKIDLLFTDIVMPGMNGDELAEAAMRRQPGIRVLFTTGFARTDQAGRSLQTTEMLHKPYRREELAERVHAVLQGS
jgi:two-component system cell cycle sensor histidine kinase/response regulator CckA